jgi:urease accessory protein
VTTGQPLATEHGRLLVLADSALPTGAFAHSWGLEWAVRRGWVTGAGDLYDWTRDALHFGVAPLEGRAVVYSAGLSGEPKGERALTRTHVARTIRMSDEVASFLPTREARTAGAQLGRSLLTAVRSVFPVLRESDLHRELAKAARGHGDRLQFPVAWGITGGSLGLDSAVLVQAYLLNTVRQWAQVAMRTIPIGQSAALSLTGRLLDDTIRLAAEVVRGRRPLTSLTPGWDVAVAGHGELDARYFRS